MFDRIIYCRCIDSEIFPKKSRNLLQAVLKSSDKDICIIDDICDKAAKKDPKFIDCVKQQNTTIIACHPRAVKWLLSSAGIEMETVNSIHYLNLMKQSISEILKDLKIDVPDTYIDEVKQLPPPLKNKKEDNSDKLSALEKDHAMQNSKNSARSWFPVIDYSKCTNCGACMDFCLFGVYEKREDRSIEVKTPLNCKDNCPACARICPHNAIIFPKYDKAPINGDMDDYKNDKPHKTPIFAMSGDELYKALSKRNNKIGKKLYK